ncbi:TonB-dependent receptor [Shewanella maritima]|uniref:TonB-dependent receptor n=1 Tax=Shewanella maritima TaxID=2520507 RepID=A0A411PGQ4_9GAMM|nr:TonB-dependent receptor [Shewanella maritima]QBF82789.1 TonB-dependent receptor [Shewanella maritima]
MKSPSFKLHLLASALLATPVFASANAGLDAEKTESIEVIKVYGEKIERSLKDSTSSISVIDKDTLDSGQYQSISSVLSEVANIVVLSGAVPDIRGVSGNGSATGFNSFSGGARARVTTLVDGVAEPFVADLGGDTGIWDIQQIEVYRGPQSTINGRNSIGGTVFIKTEDPTFDWQGAARLGYRNQDQFIDSAVMLSGPILDDELAFRITGQNVTGDSYINHVEYPDNPSKFDQSEIKTNRWRGKLLWQPSALDGFSAKYSFSINDEKGNSGRNYFSGEDPWKYERIFNRYITTKSNTHSLNFDYDLGDGKALDLLVSYMDYEWGFDSYEPNPAQEQQVIMEDASWTVDGKYTFGLNDPSFNGFVGLAYFKRSQDFDSQGSSEYFGDDSTTSSSIYSEVTYEFVEDWRLTAGGRFMREEQTRNFTYLPIIEKLDNSESIFLPKVVLQYLYSDTTTFGASIRRGFNSGGGALDFFAQEYYYYDKESVYTYELTSRSSFNNGDMNLNFNLFYNDYDGYQASNSLRRITNVEQAVTYGVEGEFNAMLTDDLQLVSGLGLLRTEIKKADADYGDIIGNKLNSAPEFTANLGLKYWFSDEFTAGISANYVSDYYGDINNTEERVAGDYVISRLNIDYQNDNWRVSGYVNNLFDEKGITSLEPASGRYPVGYAAIVDPRNIGATVTYKF